MPRASRIEVSKSIHEEMDTNFSSLLAILVSPDDIEQFLKTFLTFEEKTMLTKRLMLHLMLEKGYSSSDIASVLRMSRETIRVHKQIWSNGEDAYKVIINKIMKREKTNQLWQKIEKILKPLNVAIQARTDMKARAKLAQGDFD